MSLNNHLPKEYSPAVLAGLEAAFNDVWGLLHAHVPRANEEANHELIKRLRERNLSFELSEDERRSEGGPREGKTFVLPGTLPDLTREEARSMIKRAGGKVTNSVSKKTDYVVAGDTPGSKLARAQDLDTEILDEAGLRKLVEG